MPYHSVRNIASDEANIQIYRRNTSDVWHCRIKIPLHNHVRRSLRTTDEKKAEEKAKRLAWELMLLRDRGEALNPRSFSVVAEDFIKTINRQIKSKDKVDSYTRYIRKYFVPFFKSRRIDQITDKQISEYYEWRMDYQDEKNKVTYVRNGKKVVAKRQKRTVPAETTLKREDTVLRQTFEHARESGDIKRDRIPVINSIKIIRTALKKGKRRPSFTLEEWKKLINTSRSRCANKRLWKKLTKKNKKNDVKGITEHQQNQRKLLHDYILLMGSSGLRTMEAINLRWCDIEHIQTREGKKTVKLFVKGKGKQRETISLPSVKRYLSRIKERQIQWGKENGFLIDDKSYIFRDQYGEKVSSFNRGLTKLLIEAGLEKDRNDEKRSAYSFRHMYASFRLMYGRLEIYSLADNMGTSVEMIEKYYGHIVKEINADRLIQWNY